ncbi:MAG TPA: BCCT family transporter [Pseudonocardiaceae bacterium]|jgi:choline/carnitine/betaine transport|nr:BCCT family transporter [Pseudonocardiaceae bacterium]
MRPPKVTDWTVFGSAGALSCGIVVWGIGWTGALAAVAASVLQWLVHNLGWLLVLAATGFVVFALWVAVSRYGRIPLGRDGEPPEFRTVSWVAMMFSAGMGIGLMFYGVSEPLAHFVQTPPGAQPGIGTAMATTLFHWTLHPWAMYAVMGLALAYGSYRRGRPQLISAAFWPLLGRTRAGGPGGKAIDIMAIFATLFGSAASLGLGALQIGAGFEAGGWLSSPGTGLLVMIILVLTVAFIVSAVSGVARGIQWLSNINMVLALVLAVFVFVVGPTVLILNLIPTAIGDYFRDMATMSARTAAVGGTATGDWLASWTIFYWAWWVSWTPFVGMFIARISRGRTIRQFVIGVIAVPSVVSLVWFAIFGGAAINAQQSGADIAGRGDVEAQLFGLLQTFPLAGVAGVLVMVLVAIFFVSGADAASLVLGTLSQRGRQQPQSWNVIFWGTATGAVAVVMLLVGGHTALDGLQTLTIIAAAPFALLMILLCVSLARDLRTDPLIIADRAIEQKLREQHHSGRNGAAGPRKAVPLPGSDPVSGG